ncbi:XRE family transcriptional regulator [Helicobacter sp.]|uniref:XRE family transcriptional regulator n=1 Tax=Helicobacter sp. TaxID=218 RepID=UPI0025BC20BD|nr:XRE family transcriptional regulator [Helicobacter sp.]MCI5968315.1 XRE family transcriptional regulator [Helicobacter sp.]
MLSDAQIKEIHKIIGKNVAKIRKEKKYSQLKLSLEMGHNSVSLVSFAEIGLKGAHLILNIYYKLLLF